MCVCERERRKEKKKKKIELLVMHLRAFDEIGQCVGRHVHERALLDVKLVHAVLLNNLKEC